MENDIVIQNLSVRFGSFVALDSICARIPAKSRTAIIGPNGGGKTSLIRALIGDISYEGNILWGKNHLKPQIGYVPQRYEFDRNHPLTVIEYLSLTHGIRPLWLGISQKVREKCFYYLEMVEGLRLADKLMGGLSGGEMQRVLLASALSQEPEYLILDEPSAGVDVKGEKIFCEILEQLSSKHLFTQITISHDLSTVLHHADYVICLNKRIIQEGNPHEVLTQDVLASLFGLHLGLVDEKKFRHFQKDEEGEYS